MVTGKASHVVLTRNTNFTYLSTNYASGISTVIVSNGNFITAASIATGDYLLFGEFGSESCEIIKPTSITTNTIVLATATKFAHSESTKVSVIKYNQVKFYHTAAATFSASESPLIVGADVNGAFDIQADEFYTKYPDMVNSTGFLWYVFYNSTNTTVSSHSNASPYADFATNSVRSIFDDFDSLLNTKEISLISTKERFSWLNEGYSRTINELNLVNQSYSVPTEYSLSISASTSEYELPSDFGNLISITDGDGYQIPHITLRNERAAEETGLSLDAYYYLRGAYIGISPTPASDTTYYLYYASKAGLTSATRLASLYDNVNLPNNSFYCLVNWMMFRASQKLGKSQGEIKMYKDSFDEDIKILKITSIDQDSHRDSWQIARSANV